MSCVRPAKILLPEKEVDLKKWAVVACDQYTSERNYWEETDRIVGDAPSTLRITLPEVYLEDDDVEERISNINRTMETYLETGVLREMPEGMILLSRDTNQVCPRLGLVMEFDLEAYDYHLGSESLIRPTEKTVEDRIPPRLKVRQGAAIEVPHIMLMIDDPDGTVIEPIYEKAAQLEKVYDVELMQNGGHLEGWFLPAGNLTEEVIAALDRLTESREEFNKKYNLKKDYPIVQFATGDGNHSMATAKANWEKVKETLTPEEQENHPARYVLAEVVNIHDSSLIIEAIYRVLFGVDPRNVMEEAEKFFAKYGSEFVWGDAGEGQRFEWYSEGRERSFSIVNPTWALPVGSLQAFLDEYLKSHPEVKVDYIHGLDTLKSLSKEKGVMGFHLPDPPKGELFRGVIVNGVLPRKTFSMGSAHEKRFYMEAKRITK